MSGKPVASLLAVLGFLLAAPGAASAQTEDSGGFAEAVFGLVAPIGDDDYESGVDETFKLGVRVGSLKGVGGFELGLDWSPANEEFDGFSIPGVADVDVAAHRFRVLVGGRFGKAVKPNVFVFGRGGIGLDWVLASVETTVFGTTDSETENDFGLALELGGGVLFRVSDLALGIQLAIPIGIQFDNDRGMNEFDLDYTAYDLDLLFTLSSGF